MPIDEVILLKVRRNNVVIGGRLAHISAVYVSTTVQAENSMSFSCLRTKSFMFRYRIAQLKRMSVVVKLKRPSM